MGGGAVSPKVTLLGLAIGCVVVAFLMIGDVRTRRVNRAGSDSGLSRTSYETGIVRTPEEASAQLDDFQTSIADLQMQVYRLEQESRDHGYLAVQQLQVLVGDLQQRLALTETNVNDQSLFDQKVRDRLKVIESWRAETDAGITEMGGRTYHNDQDHSEHIRKLYDRVRALESQLAVAVANERKKVNVEWWQKISREEKERLTREAPR
jgi:hypothetical protein